MHVAGSALLVNLLACVALLDRHDSLFSNSGRNARDDCARLDLTGKDCRFEDF